MSVREYLDKAEKVLQERGNKATLAADRVLQERVNRYGREKLQQLKRDNVNMQLEKQLAGYGAKELCEVVDGHIVPRAGFVFRTARSINGNAPFYSSKKRLGDVEFTTLTFNIEVMFLMCCIVIACLLLDIPGQWMRKE